MTFFFINSKPLWKHAFYDTVLTFQQIVWINRSSHLQMIFKIDILKNFATIAGKHPCWSLFLIKLKTWSPAALLKRDHNTGVSMWILQNFLRTAFFIKHLWWMLLNKVKTNLKNTWLILLPDWLCNVIKYIKKTLNAKLQR